MVTILGKEIWREQVNSKCHDLRLKLFTPKIVWLFTICKGLGRQRLIGLAVAGFNHAKTLTKASAKGLDAR